MSWLLAFLIALAFAGAVNLLMSVRAMRRGGLGPVPVPPSWHPEYVAARARRTERMWGRMNRHYIAHHWWVGVVSAVELAVGLGGGAAVAFLMDSRPWLTEILPFAGLLVVPVLFLTSVIAMTATVFRRLRDFSGGPGGVPRPGPGPAS